MKVRYSRQGRARARWHAGVFVTLCIIHAVNGLFWSEFVTAQMQDDSPCLEENSVVTSSMESECRGKQSLCGAI